MKPWLRLTAGAVVLAGAFPFAFQESAAYSTTGESLGLSQRDFRIYDNFTQATLHENTVPDENWPGYTEVELALWKAGAEWGSRAFGDGSGDPLQSTVGDGGANFDYFWNGNAAGVGSTNANIVSAIPGPGGGVTIFTELPSSDGWRIRVYEDLLGWDDGPGAPDPGLIDFQGVLAHELGHALGLGHSGASGATMRPTISGDGSSARSIEADDQAGVQFVYGALNEGVKPRVDDVSGTIFPGGTVIVTGANFDPVNNQVLLNNGLFDDADAGGNAFVIAGLPATAGGTQISFTLPGAEIESGGLHVKVPGASGAALSEGHPISIEGAGGVLVNSVQLFGPSDVDAGGTVQLQIVDAPANAAWTIYAARRLQGSILNGQPFDVGPGVKAVATGATSAQGFDSWTSPPVPNRFAGMTLHLEARVDDSGLTYDSNFLTLSVH